jgi:hypothetical protein
MQGIAVMNNRIRSFLGLLSILVLAPTSWAQAVVPATPAAPPNLWSYLLPNADQKRACKACFCNSPLGQMLSGAAGPLSMYSGGLITNRCLANSIAIDLATKSPTSSEGAAAAIKKDEAEAKARREAVRYLGTVDCNYWPEATEALINSLRKDPNECVRFEAALSLRNGCCCNVKTIKALEICVTGSKEDGAPSERSDRVRAAAGDALARCPAMQAEPGTTPDDGIKKVEATQREQIAATARGLLVSMQLNNGSTIEPGNAAPLMPGRAGSLAAILNIAVNPPTVVQAPTVARAPMMPNMQSEPTVSRSPFVVYPPEVINFEAPKAEFGTPVTNAIPTVAHPREASRHSTPVSDPPAAVQSRDARP